MTETKRERTTIEEEVTEQGTRQKEVTQAEFQHVVLDHALSYINPRL